MTLQIFLKNPLFPGHYGADRAGRLAEPVVEIHGDAGHRDGGLEVEVTALYDGRGRPVEAPFERLFLPLAKIDYYVVV
jgi:hypothetical protein